jgi:mannose-6-phosphate isomerase-like protein (cupin superfamily)
MELLSDFDPADQVSQLLRVIRIRSTVYCRSLMAAPWGFGVEAHGHPAFHVVTEGRCWLQVDGEPGQIELAAGDLALLPVGSRHWVRMSQQPRHVSWTTSSPRPRRISTAACTTGAAGPALACSAAGSRPKAARPTRSSAPFPQPW